MKSLILDTAARFMLPLLILFSLFLLFRGHDAPGGGFSGGLVAASAWALYAIAFGVERADGLLLVRPLYLIAAGLGLAVISGVVGLVKGSALLTGIWGKVPLPLFGPVDLGTPLLFDMAVYLTVMGVLVLVLRSLSME